MSNDLMLFIDHHPYVALAMWALLVIGLVSGWSDYLDRAKGEIK